MIKILKLLKPDRAKRARGPSPSERASDFVDRNEDELARRRLGWQRAEAEQERRHAE